MIYDTTDTKFNLKRLKLVLPENLDINLDEIDYTMPVGLTHQWIVGGKLYRALRWVDKCKGASNWADALKWLTTVDPGEKIEQIQIWGHGSPGKSWMNNEPLSWKSFEGQHKEMLQQIADRLTDDAVIWFRNCSVFAGENGHKFAKAWSNNMNCKIAAHTYIISAWQSGLNTCCPGEEPSWPLTEGIAEGTPSHIKKLKTSTPWAEKSVFMLAADLPKGY